MKANRKTKTIFLIILGISFLFLPINTTNLNFKNSDFSDISLDKENLKISKVSEPIHINDTNPSMNWSVAKKDGICTGNGTYSEPYVIEDLVIDGGGSGSCILIENSNVYFKIENCTVYNSGETHPHAGILLNYTENGYILENDCHDNYCGIHISSNSNNTIRGNTVSNNAFGIALAFTSDNDIIDNIANNNNYSGINLFVSDYNNISLNSALNNLQNGINLFDGAFNNISGNVLNNNDMSGISLVTFSDNNTLSHNTANYNQIGIRVYKSDYNMILENILIGNGVCIEELESSGNMFDNNNCAEEQAISGYNLFFLLGILSIVAISLNKKLKKS
jgi:parallel beta-helix repeat protein